MILDDLNTHKPKHDRWLGRHPNVHFRFTLTNACWLNMIEIWFSILSRRALKSASSASPRQLREAIDAFIAAWIPRRIPSSGKSASSTRARSTLITLIYARKH